MAYRKLTAAAIFTGTQLVRGHALVTTATGRVIDLLPVADAGEDVEEMEGILCPGFVNAHCHTELSHLKGVVPRETGMVPFLMKIMFERQAEDSVKQAAIRQAMDSMYRNGIAAIGDICNTDDSLATKAGNRQLCFHNFIEASGFVPSTAYPRFDQAAVTRDKFLHHFPVKQVSITPHAPYSVSPKLMQLITNQSPAVLSIHNQESRAEDDFIRNKGGAMLQLFDSIGIDLSFFNATNQSSLTWFLGQVPAGIRVILVHNCYTTASDIEWIHQNGYAGDVSFCLCPNANLYIGNPLPAVTTLMNSGIPVCVGTDSLASNDALSVLSELKTLQLHFPFLTLETLLTWATFNGAKALLVDNEFGSFVKGAKPGVLQILKLSESGSLRDVVVNRVL